MGQRPARGQGLKRQVLCHSQKFGLVGLGVTMPTQGPGQSLLGQRPGRLHMGAAPIRFIHLMGCGAEKTNPGHYRKAFCP